MAEKKKKPYEIGELDQYLFGQGNHYEIYEKLGAHLIMRSWAHIWYRTENKKVCILQCGHRMRRRYR